MSRVVVLGGGESGVGSAVLAKAKGFDVFLSDMGNISEKYAAMLQEWNIPYEQGKHSEELILNADEVIKSPGIPSTAPMVRKIIEGGIASFLNRLKQAFVVYHSSSQTAYLQKNPHKCQDIKALMRIL
jgi:UDP-N-acetylmuramoylalanine-D-glutamate ligase